MINIKANKREKSTAGYNNKLRIEGFIPAILYGGKNANEKIFIICIINFVIGVIKKIFDI